LPRKNTSKKKIKNETHGLTKYNQTDSNGRTNLRPTPGTAAFSKNVLGKMIKTQEDLDVFRDIVERLDCDRTLKLSMLEMRDYAMMEMVQQKYLRYIADIPESELANLEDNPNIQKMVQKIWDVKRQIRSDCAKRDTPGADRKSLGNLLDDIDGEYEIVDDGGEEDDIETSDEDT
jgi:hypothetical protein